MIIIYFFKEALKTFGKTEGCMLQYSNRTINPFGGILDY